MGVLASTVNPREAAFQENAGAMRSLVDDLRGVVARIKEGGGEAARARHLSRGKLLPRDRIRKLLDPGAPFMELSQLAAHEVYGEDVPAAGILTGVVHANGDVGLCEQHPPIGNLRDNTFRQIWQSEKAQRLRASIKAKECFCTNEIFMWPSITYNPPHMAKAMVGARVWEKPRPLAPYERVDYNEKAPAPPANPSLPVVN